MLTLIPGDSPDRALDEAEAAVRASVVTAPVLGLTLLWPGPFTHWLTITVVLTMQPFYAATWQRALERIGGTVLGGLFGALLASLALAGLTVAFAWAAPERNGWAALALAVALTLDGLAQAAGAWLAGFLYDSFGNYAVAWEAGIASNLAALALLGALALRRRSRRAMA